MLDSIYQMTLKLRIITVLAWKGQESYLFLRNILMDLIALCY